MKTLKIVRLLLIVISLSLAGFGFTVLGENPDPAHCVCDQAGCGTVTCDYSEYGYSQFCQYKDYPGIGWALLSGSPCPYYPF